MPKRRLGRKARVAKLLKMPRKKLQNHVFRVLEDLIDSIAAVQILFKRGAGFRIDDRIFKRVLKG